MGYRVRREKGSYHYFGTVLSVLLMASCLVSCGYSIQGKANLPFQAVSLGKIANRTFEPKLEDRMQVALVEELMKNGFTLVQNSEYRIEGVINVFQMRVLSEKNSVAVEYEVIIRGDFKLVGPSGKVRPLAKGGVFIVSFLSTDSLNVVMARKEVAIEKALRDFSTELVASVIYS